MKGLKTRDLVICSFFTALIAVGAFIRIPIPYMDYFTLQFLFVLLAGMMLGSRLGAISVIIYILLGLFGFPVFASGGGISYVLKPSFGYLIGFIFSAFVSGIMAENLRDNKFKSYLKASVSGLIITYSIGIIYKYLVLNIFTGQSVSLWILFVSCFPLDIPGDMILCFISSMICTKLNPILGGINNEYK